MPLTKRATKGAPLSSSEHDANLGFLNLRCIQRVITASGTWNKPTGLRFAIVEVQGGGGGGGGCAATGAGETSAGDGGAGGGYTRKAIEADDLGATETVTIGAGGVGGSPGTNPGTAGGTSSFGAHSSATGGGGGPAAGAGGGNGLGNSQTAPDPGTGTGGEISVAGRVPRMPLRNQTSNAVWGAPGGDSVLGTGAKWVGSSSNGGDAQQGYGGGGGGACNLASQSARAGGNGAAGVVVVWEFYGEND